MKLSSWMFERQLGSLVMSSSIENGDASIVGFRLLDPENAEHSQEYLYISRMSDVVTDIRFEREFLLMNRRDRILVSGCSFDDLVNRLLAIFEMYASWEARLAAAALEPDGIEDMVRIGYEVVRRPFSVHRAGGSVIALTDWDESASDNPCWRYLVEHREISPQAVSHPIMREDGTRVDYWDDEPRVYLNSPYEQSDVIGVLLYVDGEMRGGLEVTGTVRPFGRADLQHVAVLADILSSSMFFRSEKMQADSRSFILKAFLQGNATRDNERDARDALDVPDAIQGYNLMVFKGRYRNDVTQEATLVKRCFSSSACLACIYEGLVVVAMTESMVGDALPSILQQTGKDEYTVGISLPFSDLLMMPALYSQALFAIDCAHGAAGVFDCARYAFDRIIDLMRTQNDALLLSHPAVSKLRAYDGEHGTEFGKTLYRYLLDERSLVDTAADLYIHRNTLVYRIKRIEEIIGSHLDDSYERVYILLSYLLDGTYC